MPPSRTSASAADLADQFTLQTVHTPALPSQREALRGALQRLAGIAVRMGQAAEHPKPPHDLTGGTARAMNAERDDPQEEQTL